MLWRILLTLAQEDSASCPFMTVLLAVLAALRALLDAARVQSATELIGRLHSFHEPGRWAALAPSPNSRSKTTRGLFSIGRGSVVVRHAMVL